MSDSDSPPIETLASEGTADTPSSSQNTSYSTATHEDDELTPEELQPHAPSRPQSQAAPPVTLRPFPRPSPVSTINFELLSQRDPLPDESNGPVSEDDDLPTIAEMLSQTRPSEKGVVAPRKTPRTPASPSKTAAAPVASSSKMDVDPPLPTTTPIKRRHSESPRIPQTQAHYKATKTPIREVIETLDSDSPSPSPTKAPSTSKNKHLPKRKRQRSPSESSAPQGPFVGTSSSVKCTTSSQKPHPPLSKRQKTQPKLIKFRKHEVHWQLDGNVLIQAGGVRYKLQRSLLARQSIWFREAFERAAKDGTPDTEVLFLPKDEVKREDFEVLLDALDNAITFVYSEPSFRTMASILRASYALAFRSFEEWAIQYLQNMWSPDLDNLSEDRISFAAESVLLARQCNVPGILKRAMYELVRTEGFGQQDVNDNDDDYSNRGRKRSDGRKLPTSVVAALVKAREKLTSMWMLTAAAPSKEFEHCAGETVNSATTDASGHTPSSNQNANNKPDSATAELLPTPVATSSSQHSSSGSEEEEGDQCTTLFPTLSIQAHTKLVHSSGMFEDFHADPLCGLQALIDAKWEDEGFCDACIKRRAMVWAKTREKAWKNLGLWFGIGDLDAA